MGMSADAHLVYGFGWSGEAAPPVWQDEYECFDLDKVDRDGLREYGEYGPISEEEENEQGEWVAAVIKKLDPDGVLEHHYVGYMDYAGEAIYLKGPSATNWNYDVMD